VQSKTPKPKKIIQYNEVDDEPILDDTQDIMHDRAEQLATSTFGQKQPTRMTQQELIADLQMSTLDPEISRIMARQIYVDETVNVVSPDRKKGRVKPGQINLFSSSSCDLSVSLGPPASPPRRTETEYSPERSTIDLPGNRVSMRNEEL
jgi:hypothetical protein